MKNENTRRQFDMGAEPMTINKGFRYFDSKMVSVSVAEARHVKLLLDFIKTTRRSWCCYRKAHVASCCKV